MVSGMSKSYIFDLDDTLRLGLNGKFVRGGRYENQIPLPGVVEKLHSLVKEGAPIFIVSNQGFPSFGKTSELQVWKNIIYFIDVVLGGVIKDVKLDFYHPKGSVKERYIDKRKPKPDLLLELMADYEIKKEESVYIGNAPSDEAAAANAGIDFIWAHDFFGWNKEDLSSSEFFGYIWNVDRLKEVYASNTELLAKMNAFLDQCGDRSFVEKTTGG